MRIGVITPRHPPTIGGGFTFHETVINALNSVETDQKFILLNIGGKNTGGWLTTGLPVYDVQAMFLSNESRNPNVSITELAAEKLGIDVVWYLDPHAEVLSVPVFATVLDLAHRQHPFFPEVTRAGWHWDSRESHYSRVLPRASRIFTGTDTGKDQVVRCYGVNPSNIIVNPFPIADIAQLTEPNEDHEVLMQYGLQSGFLFYPAQFWSHKNHINLLLALKQLETEHGLAPNLVLTGEDHGNLAHVRRIVDELSLHRRVHFLGFVPSKHIAALYRSAAALVFPSFFGPDNLPPLEAFSLGCPVATAKIDGADEQLGTSAAAFFDPTRPEDIAKVTAKILNDAVYRKQLVENGYSLAKIRTPESYVRVVIDAIDEFEPWRKNWPSAFL